MQPEIHLHVEPGVSKDWGTFQREAPPYSIALDGYVIGPPSFADAGPHANFDHHVEVDRPLMRQQAWVFDPYLRARTEGRLAAMDSTIMEALIEDVCTRIDRSAAGTHEQIDIDTRYEDIGGGPVWRMIVEHGPHARTRRSLRLRSREESRLSRRQQAGRIHGHVRVPGVERP